MPAQAEMLFDELDNAIGGVPAHLLMPVWPRTEALLKRVVKPETGYGLLDVLTNLQIGKWQLWIINDFQAAVITEIQNRPLHKVLWCQFIAGDDFDQWLSDWERVQAEFARSNDCVAVEFAGRRGWQKMQASYADYKPIRTIYRKEL